MPEQITLPQLAELTNGKFATFSTEIAEIKVSVEELKTSHEELTVSHEGLKASHENLVAEFQDFKAIENKHYNNLMESFQIFAQSVGEHFEEMNKRFDEVRADSIRQTRILVEQIEGRQIASLYEESMAHKERLDDHEKRIVQLEEAAG